MRFVSLIALSLIALLGLSFAVLNAQAVSLNYYIGVGEVPLSLLLVGVFILGVFLGCLCFIPTFFKLKFEIRRLRRGEIH